MFKPNHKQFARKANFIEFPIGSGLNTGLNSFELKEGQCEDARNISSRSFPAFSTSRSVVAVNNAVSGSIHSLGNRESSHVLVFYGNKCARGSAFGTLTDFTNTLTGARADVSDFFGKTVIVNGTDKLYWDGSSSTLTSIPTIPANPNMIESFGGRVFVGSTTSEEVHFCAIGDVLDWTTALNSGSIKVMTNANEKVTAMKTYAGHLVIFTRNSIHELYGYSPTQFRLIPATTDIGCVNPDCVIEMKGVLYFLADDGIYAYTGGTVPKKISLPKADRFIRDMAYGRVNEAKMGFKGSTLYVYIPQGTTGGLTVKYDADKDVWMADDEDVVNGFLNFKGELYSFQSGATSKINRLDDISVPPTRDFLWQSRANLMGSVASNKSVKRIYLITEIGEDSELNVSISTDKTGDTWELVHTVSEGSLDRTDVVIPITLGQREKWFRVKLHGHGDVTVHNMEIHYRTETASF
jgi:hypothetical protein